MKIVREVANPKQTLNLRNPRQNWYTLAIQNGHPLYKGPLPPFRQQGEEGVTMWDTCPPTYYALLTANSASVQHRSSALFPPVSTRGGNSLRQRKTVILGHLFASYTSKLFHHNFLDLHIHVMTVKLQIEIRTLYKTIFLRTNY